MFLKYSFVPTAKVTSDDHQGCDDDDADVGGDDNDPYGDGGDDPYGREK